ncbi:hypothetical protein EIP91_001568 [Steccherinum ochraceum]|uniref:F-box domain-containing protein n=1 Tax=Steccherinum ochraceum TaxID=92696 RepID=A0A4V6N762_9APHY|nr:hypothetical protein EIP91_001568 [Steccherinum ochraceum]
MSPSTPFTKLAVDEMKPRWMIPLKTKLFEHNTELQDTARSIAQLERQAADLKTRLNELLPMGRLHDDVLIEILFHFIADVYAHTKPTDRCGHYPHWFHLIFVCRRWRDLIYTTPSLWSFLAWTINPDCTRKALWLSKHAPLTKIHVWHDKDQLSQHVFWNVSKVTLKETMREVLREVYRAQELYLCVSSHDMEHSLFTQIFDRPAPYLHTIEVPELWCPPNDVDHHLPEDTSEIFPRLQRLSAGPLDVQYLKAFVVPTLTSLSLHRYYVDEDEYSPPMLLDLFAKLPLLENLSLETQSLHPGFSSVSPSRPLVNLSHLKTLNYCGQAVDLAEMLMFLTLPSSANVRIHFLHYVKSDFEHVQSIVRQMVQLEVVPSDVPIASLVSQTGQHFHVRNSSHRSFSFTVEVFTDNASATNSEPHFHLSADENVDITSLSSDHSLEALHPGILSLLPLEHIRNTVLECCPGHWNAYMAILARMHDLESLAFSGAGEEMSELFRLLSPSSSVSTGNGPDTDLESSSLPIIDPSVFLQKLSILELRGVPVVRCCYPRDWTRLLYRLTRALEGRTQWTHAGLQELKVIGFTRDMIPGKFVSNLNERDDLGALVVKVEYDEEETKKQIGRRGVVA